MEHREPTDGEFGRGFATRFKGPLERANGGQTQIAGVETIDMAEISSLDFELFPRKMKDELRFKLSELIDTFGARLVLISAHAEDTFKILQLADELGRSDVLWIVIDPDTLPQIGSLENIRDGVFGFEPASLQFEGPDAGVERGVVELFGVLDRPPDHGSSVPNTRLVVSYDNRNTS